MSSSAVTAWTSLMRATTAALGRIEHALKSEGLPALEWYDVLLELDRGDPLRPRALRSKLLMSQPNLSRLIERMVAEGLVERLPCPHDMRGHLLSITTAGQALRRRMWPVYAAGIRDAISARLDDAELSRLIALLRPLADMADAKPSRSSLS